MRATPAFQVTLHPSRAWRAAIAVPALAALAALLAWALAEPIDAARAAGLAGGLLAVAACATLARARPLSLRWDTQSWRLGPAERRGEEPWAGTLAVAIDASAWMLLRFVHDRTNGPRRTTWVAVRRRELAAQWHALRCAVYCARPAPGPEAASGRADQPE